MNDMSPTDHRTEAARLFAAADDWDGSDPEQHPYVMETLARPIELDLEQAMEFCAPDECVEVTPQVVRVRKVELDATQRARARSRAKARG